MRELSQRILEPLAREVKQCGLVGCYHAHA